LLPHSKESALRRERLPIDVLSVDSGTTGARGPREPANQEGRRWD
jgi:hypothetical protein